MTRKSPSNAVSQSSRRKSRKRPSKQCTVAGTNMNHNQTLVRV
jgi:hypothetical protein